MNTKMPVGITDFKEVKEHYYLIDKTDFIRQLIDCNYPVMMFTRTPGFGKTLTLSMLEYFFSIDKEKESVDLFNGLNIDKAGKEYMKHRGQYPVVMISFAAVRGKTWEEMYNAFKTVIQDVFKKYNYIWESDALYKEEKRMVHELI